jgi:hypothetical protein
MYCTESKFDASEVLLLLLVLLLFLADEIDEEADEGRFHGSLATVLPALLLLLLAFRRSWAEEGRS